MVIIFYRFRGQLVKWKIFPISSICEKKARRSTDRFPYCAWFVFAFPAVFCTRLVFQLLLQAQNGLDVFRLGHHRLKVGLNLLGARRAVTEQVDDGAGQHLYRGDKGVLQINDAVIRRVQAPGDPGGDAVEDGHKVGQIPDVKPVESIQGRMVSSG